jgi:DNA repair exonuclease SbcCD ATPase subunit
MKSYKVIIAIIALSLAAGLFGGYRIWGTKDKGKVDIKQLLHTLEEEIGRIEQKNKDLVASIEASKGEIQASEAIRKENQGLKDQLQNALQEKTVLESSLAELRAKETDAKKQAAGEQELRTMLDDLKGQITALESRNRDLADRFQKAERENAEKEGQLAQMRNELAEANEKASKGEKLQLMSDDLNARISALEKENRDLKAVIDNVSEITQRKQEAR